MKIYIVVDEEDDILHIFTDAAKAEECKRYELKKLELFYKFEKGYNDGYDYYQEHCEDIEIIEKECSDGLDFNILISDLEKEEKERQQKIDNEIKTKDLAEFNRIKKKYNL